MRYIGPIRQRFTGNTAAAPAYVGRARIMIQQLLDRAQVTGIMVLSDNIKTEAGVEITVQLTPSIPTVDIHVPVVEVEKKVEEEEKVQECPVPALSGLFTDFIGDDYGDHVATFQYLASDWYVDGDGSTLQIVPDDFNLTMPGPTTPVREVIGGSGGGSHNPELADGGYTRFNGTTVFMMAPLARSIDYSGLANPTSKATYCEHDFFYTLKVYHKVGTWAGRKYVAVTHIRTSATIGPNIYDVATFMEPSTEYISQAFCVEQSGACDGIFGVSYRDVEIEADTHIGAINGTLKQYEWELNKAPTDVPPYYYGGFFKWPLMTGFDITNSFDRSNSVSQNIWSYPLSHPYHNVSGVKVLDRWAAYNDSTLYIDEESQYLTKYSNGGWYAKYRDFEITEAPKGFTAYTDIINSPPQSLHYFDWEYSITYQDFYHTFYGDGFYH